MMNRRNDNKMELLLMMLWGAFVGFVLGVCGISVVATPLLFFVIDIPLIVLGVVFIYSKTK